MNAKRKMISHLVSDKAESFNLKKKSLQYLL